MEDVFTSFTEVKVPTPQCTNSPIQATFHALNSKALQWVIRTAKNIIFLIFRGGVKGSGQSSKDTKRLHPPQKQAVHPAAIWGVIQRYLLSFHQTSDSFLRMWETSFVTFHHEVCFCDLIIYSLVCIVFFFLCSIENCNCFCFFKPCVVYWQLDLEFWEVLSAKYNYIISKSTFYPNKAVTWLIWFYLTL